MKLFLRLAGSLISSIMMTITFISLMLLIKWFAIGDFWIAFPVTAGLFFTGVFVYYFITTDNIENE